MGKEIVNQVQEAQISKVSEVNIYAPNIGAPQYIRQIITAIKGEIGGFPAGAVVENLLANAGDTGSSPGLGRSHMPRSN